jgi:hypothetical protein
MASQVTFNGQTADAVYVVNPSDGSPGSPGSSLTQAETQAAVEDAISASADIEAIAQQTDPGTPITAATMPEGGTGPLGWLSATWVAATALLAGVGAPANAAATSNTGTFSLIALVKRALVRIDVINTVLSSLEAAENSTTFVTGTGDNAAVTGTLSPPGEFFKYKLVAYTASYSASPSAARNLTVTAGGQTPVNVDITVGGPAPVHIGVTLAQNQGVAYTLPASGTAGVIGRFTLYYTILPVM